MMGEEFADLDDVKHVGWIIGSNEDREAVQVIHTGLRIRYSSICLYTYQ